MQQRRNSRLTPPSSNSARFAIVAIAAALVAGVALGWMAVSARSGSNSAAASASSAATAPESPLPSLPPPSSPSSPGTTAAESPAPSLSLAPSPTVSPVPQLPSLLASIGDSYGQAYSVSPSHLRDHPEYSWVVGTAKGDGVFSIYERFRALGATPVVVNAATSGRKMSDAPRQASLVVDAVQKLKPGQTAYVTFELGTNDLCDDPKTYGPQYASDLQTAMSTLQGGLPDGSRILMVAVPDFPHFHDITQADPAAKAAYTLKSFSNRCAPYLGTNSPSTVAEADAYLSFYNDTLKEACAKISTTARIACTYNAKLTADSDFVIKDLSTVDYFHPSLSGQAKMAQDGWAADAWATVPLPAGAAK